VTPFGLLALYRLQLAAAELSTDKSLLRDRERPWAKAVTALRAKYGGRPIYAKRG
jgi:hypothetical protein